MYAGMHVFSLLLYSRLCRAVSSCKSLFSFVSRAEYVIKLTGNWLLQNSDMFWKPAIAVQADVGSTISALTAALKGYRCDPDWVHLLRSRDEETEKKNR